MTFKTNNHRRRKWSVNSPEAQSARHLPSARLREMTTKHYSVYPPTKKVPGAIRKISVALANKQPFHRKCRAWASDLTVPLELHLSKLAKFKTLWMTNQPNTLPDFKVEAVRATQVLAEEEDNISEAEEKCISDDDFAEPEPTKVGSSKKRTSKANDLHDPLPNEVYSAGEHEDECATTEEFDPDLCDVESKHRKDKRQQNNKNAAPRKKHKAEAPSKSKAATSSPECSDDDSPDEQSWKEWGNVDKSHILSNTPSRRRNRGRRRNGGMDGFFVRDISDESE